MTREHDPKLDNVNNLVALEEKKIVLVYPWNYLDKIIFTFTYSSSSRYKNSNFVFYLYTSAN